MGILGAELILGSWVSRFRVVCFANLFKSTRYFTVGDLRRVCGRERGFGASS
jgi:hypothetical protein